jgi:hypothetical protein
MGLYDKVFQYCRVAVLMQKSLGDFGQIKLILKQLVSQNDTSSSLSSSSSSSFPKHTGTVAKHEQSDLDSSSSSRPYQCNMDAGMAGLKRLGYYDLWFARSVKSKAVLSANLTVVSYDVDEVRMLHQELKQLAEDVASDLSKYSAIAGNKGHEHERYELHSFFGVKLHFSLHFIMAIATTTTITTMASPRSTLTTVG